VRRLALCLVLVAAGCGDATRPGADGSVDIDGFLVGGCQVSADCTDGNACTVDTCGSDGKCTSTPRDCSGESDECNAGACDEDDGTCKKMPVNDGISCNIGMPNQGLCMQGFCAPEPRCGSTGTRLYCTSTRTTSTSLSGTSVLDTYLCAGGLAGPERAHPFRTSTEREITVTLTSAADLELIVLEGTLCTGSAACAGQSLTDGSGNESVTFTAKANQDYIFLVESKSASTASYTLSIACAGCDSAPNLACNMTLSGDTSLAGASGMLGYSCAPDLTDREAAYKFTPAVETQYAFTLKGLTSDLDLIVLGEAASDCNPESCRASSITAGTADEKLLFTGSAATNYWVVIDGKAGGGPYQLEVACPPSCRISGNALSCGAPSDMRRNDDSARSRDAIDAWSCAAGTTGPEVVYQYYASQTAMVTVELSGLTADLDLIVVAGSFNACDPTGACVASSTQTGTASETVSFQAQAGTYYYIGVDGKNGAVSPYLLKLRSPGCPAPSCYNSINTLSCTYREETRSNDDAARSRNAIDAWSCAPDTTGPEVVYRFRPTLAGDYTVDLSGLSADLDLIVLSSTSSTACAPANACVASSTKAGTAAESVTFTGDPTLYYWIAVDGKNGAVSPYTLRLSGAACGPPVCQGSGRNLTCTLASRSLTHQNDASGATANVSAWACAPNTGGPEVAHQFTPTGAGPYTIDMIGLTGDLDLVVLEQTMLNMCDPTAACVTASTNAGASAERVTFTADPLKRYWLVVDGKNGAISPYTLAVTAGCPP
jgi:hypothetical protein